MSAPEFKGNETLYLIDIPQAGGTSKTVRLFNQKSGSRSIEAGSVELKTKDKTGSDYGDVAQSVSIEGVCTEGDKGLAYIEEAITNKKFVTVHEVLLRTSTPGTYTTKTGNFKLDSLELSHENEDMSSYSISMTLNGALSTSTIAVLPDGAPATK